MMQIGSEFEFENMYDSIPVEDGVLLFLGRNPGEWGNNIEVAIANPEDFGKDTQAFPGIDLDGLFEYFPEEANHEIGVIVKEGGAIREIYLVSLNADSRDGNNKSNFIENVINRQSNLVFVKFSGLAEEGVSSLLGEDTLKLDDGVSVDITEADIMEAYELWENKEEVDIDIVIGNELDDAKAAINLADLRKDCIAFRGVDRSIVGLKSAQATQATIAHRGDKSSMFALYGGNYKYQYDKLSVA